MKSAGNDIVALNAIDIQRTRDARFYSKFIADSELAIYQPSADLPFETFIWLLWSVKESAYKYLQRHNGDLIFSPARIIVQAINIPTKISFIPLTTVWEAAMGDQPFISGTLSNGYQQLYFQSKIYTNVLATIVDASPHFENVYWGIKPIKNSTNQNQSIEVRNFSLTKLKSVLGITNLYILKSEIGYPLVLEGGASLEIALSFAHHDRFVGYSFVR